MKGTRKAGGNLGEMCGADKTGGTPPPPIDMSFGTVGEMTGEVSLINVSVTLGR